MSIRKIKDIAPVSPWDVVPTCMDVEHGVPGHMVFDPGLYEHTCPSCKRSTLFRVGLWSNLSVIG